ncbi:MAG: efflux RND transporter periplasmic adaptor subunit [Bryobacteraceae bacterium]
MPPKRSRVWTGVLAASSAGICGWALAAFLQAADEKTPAPSPAPPAQNATAPAGARRAKATTGSIERIARVTGTTSARNFASIAGPMLRGPDGNRALVLIKLARSGSQAKKGDVVAQIDAQAMKDHVDDLDSQIQQADSDIKKRKAEQAIDWENLQQTLRVTKAELDKAKLEHNAREIRTVVDQELLKLSVEELEAQHKQQLGDLKSKQDTYRAEIRILELTKERQVRHRDRHKVDIEKFAIRAPLSGLVVMQTIWRTGEMGQIQEGDQVAPGQPFMRIVDQSSMQIEGAISQVTSDELRIGQQATVRFDAFPGLVLPGKVHSIGAIAIGGWRQNYYIRSVPLKMNILGTDNRVIPDLSTSAEIVIDRAENAVVIPIEAVKWQDGRPQVYVANGAGAVLRAIKLGVSNNTHAAVAEGLRAGDEVYLDAPPAESLAASN